jgi:low molecular weight protein-tyrosine phosphatase
MPPFTVLQVCMGNICRSPMAERLLVAAAREVAGPDADDELLVHGAGTGGWHAGDPMDPGAAKQVLARGGDVDGFRARHLRGEHIDASDLILTATAEQVEFVLSMRPDAASRTFVLGEFGRLLRSIDLAELPAGSVYDRGVALVEAVDLTRGGKPAEPDDNLDDPWGRSDRVFARIADEIESTTKPLAAALFAGH